MLKLSSISKVKLGDPKTEVIASMVEVAVASLNKRANNLPALQPTTPPSLTRRQSRANATQTSSLTSPSSHLWHEP